MRASVQRGVAVLVLLSGCIPQLPIVEDPCATWQEPGLFRLRIDQPDDPTRRPYVYVPGTEGPRPIVVLLHGGLSSGPKIEEVTGFQELAEKEGFVLLYPNGLGWPFRGWNAGPGLGDSDDVGFLDDLLEDVSPKVCGDRVLAAGFSQGAMMAHRWACETTGRVDAVGVSSGPLLVDACDGPPVPVRHYHGLADTVIPSAGGVGPSGVKVPSVEETLAVWRDRNFCGDVDPEVSEIGKATTCRAWPCQAPTEACLIDAWPHMWPGGAHAEEVGFDATRAIWSFFLEAVPQAAAPPVAGD